MQQTVDVYVDMYIPPTAGIRMLAIGVFTHILREASAWFARSTKMGNAKASTSGTSNGTALTHFFYKQLTANEVGPTARHIIS